MKYTHLQNVLINLTQLFGNIWFGLIKNDDITADESTSAFVWRKQYKGWIKFVNFLARNPNHCEEAYVSEKDRTQISPDYLK